MPLGRLPVVPLAPPVAGADALVFVGDDGGEVTTVNTLTGQVAWRPPPYASTMFTGAPGGFFTRWGGPADVVLVGARTSGGAGVFYTFDLTTGLEISSFDGDGPVGPPSTLGAVNGTPVLDIKS